MEIKKEGLSIPKAPKLDDPKLSSFLHGQSSKEEDKQEITWQANIRFTKEEEDIVRDGHKNCLEKMPMYQYQKEAILEKAKKDTKKRAQLNQVIKDLED